MSEKTSPDRSNGSETDDEFRVSALLLKKRVHNTIEKRRKDKINQWIHKLAEVLPFKEPKRDSKVHILENLFNYVNELKDKNDRLMFASQHTLNEIHVKEIQRLTKRCKELEERNKCYYRLLETAGISAASWPKDLQFERPMKYSKKITEQQLNEFLGISSEKSCPNNKRANDSDDDSNQMLAKKFKCKNRSKKRRDREDRDLKCSPLTPVLPKPGEQLSPATTSTSASSSQTTSSGPLIIINDQNIVNASNGFSGLNAIQLRPPMAPQQLQIMGQTIDTNLLSRQLLLNLNPPPPPPPPQATAVLLPNGQLLPIITQPQPQQQQQPLIYATNQGILVTTPTQQPQATIISGQRANIISNVTPNTISLTQKANESNQKKSPEKATERLTTTIEAVVADKRCNKKVSKSVKKQLFVQKVKNAKKEKRKAVIVDESSDDASDETNANDKKEVTKESKVAETKSKASETKSKNKSEKSLNKSKDKIKSRSPSDKSCEKNENSMKSQKSVNNSLSKQVVTAMSGQTDKAKEISSCDILAKATQSIFSPPPNTKTSAKQVSNSGSKTLKDISISNKNKANNKSRDNRKDIRINDNNAKSVDNNNKCNNSVMAANKLDSNPVNERSKTASTGNEVSCAADRSTGSANTTSTTNTATAANKANTDVINDTNKNDNYVRNTTTVEHKSKIEKTSAAGNKAESVVSKTASDSVVSADNKTNSVNCSPPEPTTTSQPNNRHSNVTHQTHQSFSDQSAGNGAQSGTSANGLAFGFGSHQNQTNSSISSNEAAGGDTQPMMTENELPSLLLSLNDENEVTTESVHSVSNSSLPAFLSLSPEHLNEYLPKDSNTDESARDQTLATTGTEIQFRLQNTNDTNVETNSSVRPHDQNYSQRPPKEKQNYNQYSKSAQSVATTQSESRSFYTSNFPTISTLITNDYSDFSLNASKSMFPPNNSTNYLENLNPKSTSQSNNLFQFPLQNDNSLMQLYPPMHSYPIPNYLQNSANTNTTNAAPVRTNFLLSNENQSQSTSVNSVSKNTQNTSPSQSSQGRNQNNVALNPHSKPSQTSQQNSQSQTQSQTNGVIPIRAQRHPSTEQLQSQPQPQQQQQRHPTQHTSPVSSGANSSNKPNTNPVQYSNHNSFSSYSAEALIRQNEPTVATVQHNANSDQNRYNSNTDSSLPPRLSQQNLSFNNDRNQSRAAISYSAESLIQSNQIPSKTSQRESENDSVDSAVNNDNRISYYQPNSHNNNTSNISNNSNNLVQRTDQNNNSNNLFNFDHTLNTRLMPPTSQTCTNNYPQITFNSHLPDLQTNTTSESVFPITSTAPTINSSNANRSNSGSAISSNSSNANASSGQMGHSLSTPAPPPAQQQQHSPVIYPSNGSQNSNSHQSKRSSNGFTSAVNPFIQTNTDNSYQNPNHSTTYPSSGQPIADTNINSNNTNQYQRTSRNTDIRFGNCLQSSNQNSNSSMTGHNQPNTGCFFSNAPPNTTYFPASSTTPFPPLLPSAASPFDPAFSTTHRPTMFANSFIPDFNAPFVNSTAANPLPPITGSNFNINPPVNNSNNTSNAVSKTRETHPTSTRSASNVSRSPNPSKHSKLSANSNSSNTKSKKQNNNKHSDHTNSSSSRHSNDSYLSMNDLMSLTTPTNQTNTRYSNFSSSGQTSHHQSRQPVASLNVTSSNSTNTKNVTHTSSADTSSSYSLFRPQSHNSVSNASSVNNFSVNSLQNSNRTAPTTSTASHFGSSSGAHHSSHATNFHLSNIFPDINSTNTESLTLSPMKFPPPVAPMVPPPVGPALSQSAMDPNSYPNPHPGGHHQNLYHSHHSSARISTPHNAFNTFLSSGTPSAHNPNAHSFDPQITPNRSAATPQMSGLTGNSPHPTATFAPTHPHSHHSYPNIVPSFNF